MCGTQGAWRGAAPEGQGGPGEGVELGEQTSPWEREKHDPEGQAGGTAERGSKQSGRREKEQMEHEEDAEKCKKRAKGGKEQKIRESCTSP